MTIAQYFIEPLDVLFLRSNKLFGSPGSFGESMVPPWPSVAAGALRSALLVQRGHDLASFALGGIQHDNELGTPDKPGTFTLTSFQVARKHEEGLVEPLFSPPADLIVSKPSGNSMQIARMDPRVVFNGISSSAPTEKLAVLPEAERAKAVPGFLLNAKGWSRYLRGEDIDPNEQLVASGELWKMDTRVGIGLDPSRRTSDEGKLFTVQAVAFRMSTQSANERSPFKAGFLAAVKGAELPARLTLRMGGDGRGALAERVVVTSPEPDYADIAGAGRCRLILTTPGIFADGWRPTGVTGAGKEFRFDLHGVRARVTCAAVPRAEVVSGFDLAKPGPKPARRVAPVGSVYWLEDLESTPEQLRKLADHGLWRDALENDPRRAEGFNRCAFAAY